MPKSGRKNQPRRAEPLLASVEIHLRQVMSCASAALHTLRLAKGNFTALTQAEAGTESLSNLTDAQVVSVNLLESIRQLGAKATATVTTAERTLISSKKSDKPEHTEWDRATEASGPSARTLRRKNLREARRKQSDKSDPVPTDATPSRATTSKNLSSGTSVRPITPLRKKADTPQTPAPSASCAVVVPQSTGKKRAKNSTGDKGDRKETKVKRSLTWNRGSQRKRSESQPAATSPSLEQLQRSSSLSPEGRICFKVHDR